MAGTPDGWYPDPSGEQQLRWFGGGQWTEHTKAMPKDLPRAAAQDEIGGRGSVGAMRKLARRWWRWPVWARVVSALFVVGLVGAAAGGGEDDRSAAPASASSSTQVPLSTAPAESTIAVEPSTTLSPIDDLQAQLRKKLRDDKALVITLDETDVVVWISLADNVTKGLAERSTQRRAAEVLEFLQPTLGERTLQIAVRAELVNDLGETSTGTLLVANYAPDIVSRIVFKNFDVTRVFSPPVANVSGVIPAGCGLTDTC